MDVYIKTYHPVIIYEAEAAVVVEEPQEVQIEVAINWTQERIEQEIRATFPEDPVVAVAVAKAESELAYWKENPEAHTNKKTGNVICYGSFGLMQIGCVHNMQDTEALKDVQFNLKKARAIYDDSMRRKGNGWLPWGAYTDGRYKLYL